MYVEHFWVKGGWWWGWMWRLTQLLQACVRNRKGAMGRMRWVVGVITVAGAADDSRQHSLHIRTQSSSSLPANVISGGWQIVITIHREDDQDENLKQNRATSSYDQ